jgi:hypothetical protein
MRISNTVFLFAMICLAGAECTAQSPSSQPKQTPAQTPAASSPAAPANPSQVQPSPPAIQPNPPASASGPSATLQPSLDTVFQTLTALKLDKWKKGTVRTEAGDKIAAILKDLHETLPPLMKEADAAPGTMSKQLPVSRNVDALYDVVLRVFEAARVSAPPDQITKLDQDLAGLNTARMAYEDRLQDSAAAFEKQMTDLQATVKAQAAFKCPVPPAPVVPVCPAPVAPKPRRKPKPPVATPQTTTPAPATTTAPKLPN